MKIFIALVALGLATPGIATAQSFNGYTLDSWNKAIEAYDASSRIEFKSDWAKHIIKTLRAYEVGQ